MVCAYCSLAEKLTKSCPAPAVFSLSAYLSETAPLVIPVISLRSLKSYDWLSFRCCGPLKSCVPSPAPPVKARPLPVSDVTVPRRLSAIDCRVVIYQLEFRRFCVSVASILLKTILIIWMRLARAVF